MIPTSKADGYRKIVSERDLLRENFPFLNSRISGLALTCRGRIQPTEHSRSYRIEIRYAPWNSPEVRVIDPKIKFTRDVHMYHNDTLCLFDWREQPWQKHLHLHETIVPWVAEWLLYYELWLLTGKWLGKSAIHRKSATEDFTPPANAFYN